MIHFDQGEGLHREARGSDVWFKALSMDTNGRFSFMERTLPPTGRMPPPRRHAATPTMMRRTLCSRASLSSASARTWSRARAAPSCWWKLVKPIRLVTPATNQLVLHASGLDGYFEELAQLWAAPEAPNRNEELALMQRHGIEPA